MSQKRRTETDIMIEVLKTLYDLPGVWVYRNNCGVAKPPGAARAIRFGLPGQADLSGIVQVTTPRGFLGVRLEVEVKTPSGKVSPEQVAFGARITEMGGCYILARSADEAVQALTAWRKDHEDGN